MTKIKNKEAYPIKQNPTKKDYFIGSDAEKDGETVNFSMQSIINILSGFTEYIYSKSSLPITTPNGDGYFQTNGVTNFSLVTTIHVSKITIDGQNLTPYLNFIKNNLTQFTLHIVNKQDKNNFAYYTLVTVTEQLTYFAFTVNLGVDNDYLGQLVEKEIYAFNYEKVSSGGSGNPLFTANIPVILSDGKFLGKYPNGSEIPAFGKTAEWVINDIAQEYIKPAFTGVTLGASPNSNPIEVGTTLTNLSITYSANNDSLGNQPINRAIAGDGYNRSIMAETSPYLGTASSVSNVNTTKNWTVSGTDKDNFPIGSISTSRTWQWRYYFGALPVNITSANLNTLQQNKLTAGKNTTWTCTIDNFTDANYTYVVYPSIYGNLSEILQDGALNVITAFNPPVDVAFTNALGVPVTMRVYKSNSTKAFLVGVNLVIS
jgi:hypothetical protein